MDFYYLPVLSKRLSHVRIPSYIDYRGILFGGLFGGAPYRYSTRGISTLFELIGALVLLGIIEEFIVTNSENPINFYPILFGILFGLLALILGKKIDYLHVGTWLHSGL